MKPDAIIKCVENYAGKTESGGSFEIKKGEVFLRTTTDKLIFLNYYDDPARQLPWFTPDEFNSLIGKYLVKSSDL